MHPPHHLVDPDRAAARTGLADCGPTLVALLRRRRHRALHATPTGLAVDLTCLAGAAVPLPTVTWRVVETGILR